jgi:hypothetical protein
METLTSSTETKKRISIQRTTVGKWFFVFIQVLFFPFPICCQSVTTDKVEYSTNEMIYISGFEWNPLETINLVVTGDQIKPDGKAFLAKTDREGNFRSEPFRPEDNSAGFFHLAATGLSSGHTSTITFNVSGSTGSVKKFNLQNGTPSSGEFEFRCYPNPFVSEITFEISMSYESRVIIEICNNAGTLLEMICDEDLKQGEFRKFEFDASRYPHSFFIYRVTTRYKKQSGIIMKLL